ncbi:MAG: hypothetical protein RL308_2319 [Bacteroidota bacterium]|jgi:uncharacterized membrane protein
MDNIVTGATGLIHLISSIIALVTGLLVLTTTKGTTRHKKIGYIYVVSMVVLNLTAFMIYSLFGKFGIFHWFAILSFLTLLLGIYPVLVKNFKNYLLVHFNYMYWSVVGLYCAFCAEILTRIPFIYDLPNKRQLFGILTGVSIFIVMTIATIIFVKMKPKWTKQYERK